MITIEVLFFAQLKEAFGQDRLSMVLPPNAVIADAAEEVLRFPALRPFMGLPLRYAVNEEFKSAETKLHHQDQLAILTPVAGG